MILPARAVAYLYFAVLSLTSLASRPPYRSRFWMIVAAVTVGMSLVSKLTLRNRLPLVNWTFGRHEPYSPALPADGASFVTGLLSLHPRLEQADPVEMLLHGLQHLQSDVFAGAGPKISLDNSQRQPKEPRAQSHTKQDCNAGHSPQSTSALLSHRHSRHLALYTAQQALEVQDPSHTE